MRVLNIVTLLLVIIGGLNWGLVAIGGYDADLVAGLFGGEDSALARIVYGLVGLSALYQIVPFARSLKRGQVDAEAGRHHATTHVTR